MVEVKNKVFLMRVPILGVRLDTPLIHIRPHSVYDGWGVSDGGVHSHISYHFALLEAAKQHKWWKSQNEAQCNILTRPILVPTNRKKYRLP